MDAIIIYYLYMIAISRSILITNMVMRLTLYGT